MKIEIKNNDIVGTGGFNEFPPNMKEITEKDFAQSKFFVYSPEVISYRQAYGKESDIFKLPGSCLKIFWYYDGTGIIFTNDYWGGKVRYFSCAVCEHDFVNSNPKSFTHVSTCKKCGFVEVTDSSD